MPSEVLQQSTDTSFHVSALHTTVISGLLLWILPVRGKLWQTFYMLRVSLTRERCSNRWSGTHRRSGEVWTQFVLPCLDCWSIPIVLQVEQSHVNEHSQRIGVGILAMLLFFHIREKHIVTESIPRVMYLNSKLTMIILSVIWSQSQFEVWIMSSCMSRK